MQQQTGAQKDVWANAISMRVEYQVPRSATQPFALIVRSPLIVHTQQKNNGDGFSPAPYQVVTKDYPQAAVQLQLNPFISDYTPQLSSAYVQFMHPVGMSAASAGDHPLSLNIKIERTAAPDRLATGSSISDLSRRSTSSLNVAWTLAQPWGPTTSLAEQRTPSLVPLLNNVTVTDSTQKITLLISNINSVSGPATAVYSSAHMVALVVTFTLPELDPCLHCAAHAACAANQPVCSCTTGYTGGADACADLDECQLGAHSCHALAACTNGDGSFTCSCTAGYTGTGTACANIDECAVSVHNCHSAATCSDTVGSFACSCSAGYTGDGVGSCNDVNECSTNTHNCHTLAKCTNDIGSFTCSCNAGYTGTGTACANIDECAASVHNCHSAAACSDTEGSFACSCNAGYTSDGVGSCNDVNECSTSTHTCHAAASCTNTESSFTCACSTGYTGDGKATCANIDECATLAHNCLGAAACVDSMGSFQCSCPSGYIGDGVQWCNITVQHARATFCAQPVVRVRTTADLEVLAMCAEIKGALDIAHLIASEAQWSQGLANLRSIELYLLVQNCTGFRYAHLAALASVGSLTKALLYQQGFAVALLDNHGAFVTQAELTDTIANRQLRGSGHVWVRSASADVCVLDSPAFWWAEYPQLLLQHSTSVCGGTCRMNAQPNDQCVSRCDSGCLKVCPGAVFSSVAQVQAYASDCQLVAGSLILNGLSEAGTEVALLARLQSVQIVTQELIITECSAIIDTSFLSTLYSVGRLAITHNDNLISIYLPALAANAPIIQTNNPRLCSADPAALDRECATLEQQISAVYTEVLRDGATNDLPTTEQMVADLLAQLELPASTLVTVTVDGYPSLAAALEAFCLAAPERCPSESGPQRRSTQGTGLNIQFTLTLGANESYQVTLAMAHQSVRPSAVGSNALAGLKRAVTSSLVDQRLTIVPRFNGMAAVFQLYLGASTDQPAAQALDGRTSFVFQFQRVSILQDLSPAARDHLRDATRRRSPRLRYVLGNELVDQVLEARLQASVPARSMAANSDSLKVFFCDYDEVGRPGCLPAEWTYTITAVAVNGSHAAAGLLRDFAPRRQFPVWPRNVTLELRDAAIGVTWAPPEADMAVQQAVITVARSGAVGQVLRSQHACVADTSSPNHLTRLTNPATGQPHFVFDEPNPQLELSRCFGDQCLQPWTTYVLTLKLFGAGRVRMMPISHVFTTTEGRPATAPRQLRLDSATATTAVLAFLPPSQSNGVIVGATVSATPEGECAYSGLAAPTVQYVSLLNPQAQGQVCQPDLASLQVVVTGLVAYCQYTWSVVPHTASGPGAVAAAVQGMTGEDQPRAPSRVFVTPVVETPDTYRLTWTAHRGANVSYLVVAADDPLNVLARVTDAEVLLTADQLANKVRVLTLSAHWGMSGASADAGMPASSFKSSGLTSMHTIMMALAGVLGVAIIAFVLILVDRVKLKNAFARLIQDDLLAQVNSNVHIYDAKSLVMSQMLGKGRHGQVFLASVASQSKDVAEVEAMVAVKTLTGRYGHITHDAWREFFAEIATSIEISRLGCSRIIKTLGVSFPHNSAYLVQEYASYGSLLDCLRGVSR